MPIPDAKHVELTPFSILKEAGDQTRIAQAIVGQARLEAVQIILNARKRFADRAVTAKKTMKGRAEREALARAEERLAIKLLALERARHSLTLQFATHSEKIILALTEELTGSTFEFCPDLIIEKIHSALAIIRSASICLIRTHIVHSEVVQHHFPPPQYSYEADDSLSPGVLVLSTAFGSVELNWKKDLELFSSNLSLLVQRVSHD